MTHRVVVLGAGYAGFPAAKRLARQVDAAGVEVVLVNATDTFLERPRLHQLATGQQLRTIRLADLLAGSEVQLRVGQVTAIDPDTRCLTLADESTVEYDTLVYALGSTGDLDTVPGIREHASGFTGGAAAHRLHRQLSTVDGGRVVVCGGGLTGIESAAEFAESFPGLEVELLTAGRVGGWLSPKAGRYLTTMFRRLGVQVRENARVAEIAAGRLILTDGATVPFAACVWAGGFIVPELARESGLKVDGQGRILTDGTLRSLSHPDIYAIGDAGAVPGPWGDALAMGCRTGGFSGPQVADILATRLAGKEPRPFHFRYNHECISLGRKRALIQFLNKTGTPRNSVLKGWLGLRYKEMTLRGAVLLFRWPGPYLRRRRVTAEAVVAAVK